MFNLWLFHYAIIQKLAKRRYKNFPDQMALSAFTFLCILSVSLFAIFIDKDWLLSLYNRSPRLPIGPIVSSILMVLILPSYAFFSSKYFIKGKLNKLRKIVILRNKIKRVYSIIYVCSIFCLFVLGITFILLSFPVY